MTRRKPEYIVLCGQVVGNADAFSIEYNYDGERFCDRQDAIKHGFKIRESDDFNIGVVKGRKLVSLDWMDEAGDEEPDELARIAENIGL